MIFVNIKDYLRKWNPKLSVVTDDVGEPPHMYNGSVPVTVKSFPECLSLGGGWGWVEGGGVFFCLPLTKWDLTGGWSKT